VLGFANVSRQFFDGRIVGLLATVGNSESVLNDSVRPSLLDWLLLYTTAVAAAMAACPRSTTTGIRIAPE
jgi:hypothetical protein